MDRGLGLGGEMNPGIECVVDLWGRAGEVGETGIFVARDLRVTVTQRDSDRCEERRSKSWSRFI